MSDDNTFELSRRKALVGLGAMGVASAGAGVGTSAYFTDEENFEGNEIQAGELNLAVDFSGTRSQDGVDTTRTIPNNSTADGDAITGAYLLEDVKPGDSGTFTLEATVTGNPAFVFVGGELVANDENSVTEPEADSSNETNSQDVDGDIDGDGELAQKIDITGLTGIDGKSPSDFSSLKDLLNTINGGVPIGGGSLSAESSATVFVDWEVPTTVGNEIQTDSVEFAFNVGAIQERYLDASNASSEQPLNDTST